MGEGAENSVATLQHRSGRGHFMRRPVLLLVMSHVVIITSRGLLVWTSARLLHNVVNPNPTRKDGPFFPQENMERTCLTYGCLVPAPRTVLCCCTLTLPQDGRLFDREIINRRDTRDGWAQASIDPNLTIQLFPGIVFGDVQHCTGSPAALARLVGMPIHRMVLLREK